MTAKNLPRHMIGGAVMLLAAGVVAGLFFIEMPNGNREIALVVLGIVIGWGGSVVQYHYGTSEGSSRKTEIMHEKRGF